MFPFLIRKFITHRRIVKFLIAGGIATFVEFYLLYFLKSIMGHSYLTAQAVAFIVSFFVSFALQRFWTFQDTATSKIKKQLGLYFTVGFINLCINTGAMYFFVSKLSINYIIAQIIVNILLTAFNYLSYRWIFKKGYIKFEILSAKFPKVLMATGIFPPEIGGPATIIEELAKDLTQRKIAIRILTYTNAKRYKFIENNPSGYQVIRVKKSQLLLVNYINYFWEMCKYGIWADLIYAFDTYSVGYCAYLMKRILNVKYIIRFVGDSAWEVATTNNLTKDNLIDFQKNTHTEEIEKLKERRKKILINADKVIVVSQYLRQVAEMIGVKKENIEIVYNAVNFMESTGNDDEISQIKNIYNRKAKIITTSCRLTPWKGVDGLIKIMPSLKKIIGYVNFLVLGEGEELEKLKLLTERLGVGANVFFLGRIDHTKIINYFKASDVFILNSNYEGLSHTLLEAMQAGVPIIASKAGGNLEVITDKKDGLLVDYNNEQELLAACIEILTNKELAASFILNAKKKLENFQWEKTVSDTSRILLESIN